MNFWWVNHSQTFRHEFFRNRLSFVLVSAND
jgi:hypothetical protein